MPNPAILPILAALSAGPAWAQDGWPDLSSPAMGVDSRPLDVAVLVGIEDYDAMLDVPGAVQAVRDWQAWLQLSLGLPEARVLVLEQEEATPEAMATAIGQALGALRAGGRLWFVFVGQASPTCDGRDVLLFAGSAGPEAAGFYEGSILLSTVRSLVSLGAPEQSVFILDASINERDRSIDKLACLTMPVMPPVTLVPGERELLISAAQPEELAGSLLGSERSALSWLLLAALRGWGDSDGDRAVTAAEALAFAQHLLEATERRMPQTPELWGAGGDTVLARAGEPAADLDELLAGVAAVQTSARAGRVDALAAGLQREATADWARESLRGAAGAQAFLDRSRFAMVQSEGQKRYVFVPELSLARAMLGSSAEAAVAPVGAEVQASHDQLTGELRLQARKNAWKGVEQAFLDLLALAPQGVEPTLEDLDLGAQAARALGKTQAVRERLERIALRERRPETLAWLDEIERSYGAVDLRDRGAGAGLEAIRPPLPPDQRAAIEAAAAQLAATGRFQGLLPAGAYRFGAQRFLVIPGDPVVEVGARRTR